MRKTIDYDLSAQYYDQLYAWKDYKKESGQLKALIRRFKRSPGRDMLEVACGTGGHAPYLKKDFYWQGLDASSAMLAIARRKLPGAKLIEGDMVTFGLNQRFDVLLCLFSSIGHVLTLPRLGRTLKNFSRHLKPGGLVIIEPWFPPGFLKPGKPGLTLYDKPELKIARLNNMVITGRRCRMDMQLLIAARGKPVKHLVEPLEMGLFTQAEP